MIQQIPIEKLYPHPDNRPLGINEEKVEQLAEMMKVNGYDQSKPIKARPNGKPDAFQIIEGEHRWRAAQKAGIDSLPVFVKELSDEDALIELVAGNVQTDNHPLDIGVAALRLTESYSKTQNDKTFGDRIGKGRSTITTSKAAARVFLKAKSVCRQTLLSDKEKLYHISTCLELDWMWMHDLIAQKGLSKQDAIEISKRTRQVDATTKPGYAAKVFDITEIKKECATAKERAYNEWISLLESIEDCAGKLDVIVTIENPGHNYPFKTTIQERWRSPGYSNFRDITITAVNTNSGKPAEFYEGRFEYMLYGYYDQINDKFGEVVFVNFPRLRQMFSSGLIVKGDGNNGGEKNQDFFTFKFDELIKFGCVDWSNVKGFEKQLPPYKVKPDHWESRYYEEAKTAEYWRQVANNNIKSIKI